MDYSIKIIKISKHFLFKPLKETKAYDKNPELSSFIFATTPVMSTYLAAFVVGEYGVISGKLHNNASVSVYTPLNSEKMGEFTLDVKIVFIKHFKQQLLKVLNKFSGYN